MASNRLPGSNYAESTKQAIVREVHRRPGCTGRQIAEALGLDKSRVNSFLYGEGKHRFHLEVKDWRWCAPSATPLKTSRGKSSFDGHAVGVPIDPQTPTGDRRPESICAALAKMAQSQAILKIRTFSLDIVELAFQEADFSLLSDSLQAELATRRAVLLPQATQSHPTSNRPPAWLLWALGFGMLLTMINLMNTPKEINPQLQSPGDEVR